MNKQTAVPRSPVSAKKALEHGLLTVRRAWAGGLPGFKAWDGYVVRPEPLRLHDLNGQLLFYDYEVVDGENPVGVIRSSASKLVGPTVASIQMTPRTWDPDKVMDKATKRVSKLAPDGKIVDSRFVCYSYPKVGVQVTVQDKKRDALHSMIFDAATLEPVETYGADELEGFTAWSYYKEIAEPKAAKREQMWEWRDEELEKVRAEIPAALDPDLPKRDLAKIKTDLIPRAIDWQAELQFIPWFTSREIRFSPRCNTHKCFELYAQKNNIFCAVATGQMILDFYRYYYTQDEIAVPMQTVANNGSFNEDQVTAYEELSHGCLDATYDTTANWFEARAEINANRPLKSGVPGHARACAGWMKENFCLWPGPCKRWLKIYDPSPPNANICAGGAIYWEDWETVTHTNFIYIRHRSTPCS